MTMASAGMAIAMILAAAACMKTLPDQDRRILQTPPAAKLTSDILAKEFGDNKSDANRKYWGQAIEVTGVVARAESSGPRSFLVFGQGPQATVRANLLDDQAAAIIADAAPGQRLTLRCFCEGLQAGEVRLKSCIRAKAVN